MMGIAIDHRPGAGRLRVVGIGGVGCGCWRCSGVGGSGGNGGGSGGGGVRGGLLVVGRVYAVVGRIGRRC